MKKLTTVVLNWNSEPETRACLNRVTQWESLQPEVTVVDNASTSCDLQRLQDDFPDVRWILSETNRGFGGGNNLALREVESEYVLLLNGDATIGEEDASRLIEVLEADSSVFAVGPVIENEGGVRLAGGRDIARYRGTHWRERDIPAGRKMADGLYEVDYCPGTVALLRSNLVRELGYLDEEYFFGGEMADVCARARENGYRSAVLLSVAAGHDMTAAAGRRSDLYPYYALRNRFLFVRKSMRSSAAPLVTKWTLYGVIAIARALARREPAMARALSLALVDGLSGRYGGQNDRVLGLSRSRSDER